MVSFRSVDFSDGQDKMTSVYATRTDHRAFPAQLARLQEVKSLIRMGIENFLNGFPDAGAHELSGRTYRSATSAGHTLADIRLNCSQLFELFPVEQVKIDSGAWDQTETEIYHLSRTKVL